MTTDFESELRHIVDDEPWVAPQLKTLRGALDGLDATMKKLAGTPGWEGAAAHAAGEQWVRLQKAFTKVADAVASVEAVISRANGVRDDVRRDLNNLTVGHVPSWVRVAAKDADATATIFIPALGRAVPATSAVNLFESFLGDERRQAVAKIHTAFQTELNACAAELKSVDFSTDFWDVPPPEPTPVPDPTIRGGGGGGYTPSPNPSYDVPAYPGGGSSTPGGGSSAPGGGSSAPGGGSSAPGNGGSFPSSPTYHSPSIDDGSVGTLPGYSGGAGGGFGAGGMGGAGGYGGGANSGLTAGVFGGATAAGAAALRFGTGGGFGGGGMGGGGMGGGGLSGGVSGSSGLLDAGGAGQGGAGGSAGTGSGAGSAGAAGGARGGMMGGQPMGGGAGAGKKDKRPGLGGLMAPKIEDDEQEFIPLPDGARAGGRDQF